MTVSSGEDSIEKPSVSDAATDNFKDSPEEDRPLPAKSGQRHVDQPRPRSAPKVDPAVWSALLERPEYLEDATKNAIEAMAALNRHDLDFQDVTKNAIEAMTALNRHDHGLQDVIKNAIEGLAASSRHEYDVQDVAKSISKGFGGIDPQTWAWLDSLRGSLPASVLVQLAAGSSFSRAETFETRPDERRVFSKHLTRQAQLYEATEIVVSGINDLMKFVTLLGAKNGDLPLVWRGQGNADWGLHSGLYRFLLERSSVTLPDGGPVSGPQDFPSEADMATAERGLFRFMQDSWRMDDFTALELLARLQHQGGPTRLLDVTRNPLMALWFAVEPNEKTDDNDARLFAIASRPMLPDDEGRPSAFMENPVLTQSALPFWLDYESDNKRRSSDWGTGTRRRIWLPPSYDERIAAQNAAFLLEGVPLPSEDLLDVISVASESGPWRWADLSAAASFYVLPAKATRKVRPKEHRLAPVFTFRIPARAKASIWEQLTRSWGLLPGVVYPDIQGLSQYLRQAGAAWAEHRS